MRHCLLLLHISITDKILNTLDSKFIISLMQNSIKANKTADIFFILMMNGIYSKIDFHF